MKENITTLVCGQVGPCDLAFVQLVTVHSSFNVRSLWEGSRMEGQRSTFLSRLDLSAATALFCSFSSALRFPCLPSFVLLSFGVYQQDSRNISETVSKKEEVFTWAVHLTLLFQKTLCLLSIESIGNMWTFSKTVKIYFYLIVVVIDS